MHNNEERFSCRLVPVSILEGRRTRAKRGERGRQVFRLSELTKSLRRMEKLLSEPHAQESSAVHENLSINQKIYEFRIRNEELSRVDPKLSCATEFWVSVRLSVCLPGGWLAGWLALQAVLWVETSTHSARIQTKTNNINFKTLRCISN